MGNILILIGSILAIAGLLSIFVAAFRSEKDSHRMTETQMQIMGLVLAIIVATLMGLSQNEISEKAAVTVIVASILVGALFYPQTKKEEKKEDKTKAALPVQAEKSEEEEKPKEKIGFNTDS